MSAVGVPVGARAAGRCWRPALVAVDLSRAHEVHAVRPPPVAAASLAGPNSCPNPCSSSAALMPPCPPSTARPSNPLLQLIQRSLRSAGHRQDACRRSADCAVTSDPRRGVTQVHGGLALLQVPLRLAVLCFAWGWRLGAGNAISCGEPGSPTLGCPTTVHNLSRTSGSGCRAEHGRLTMQLPSPPT